MCVLEALIILTYLSGVFVYRRDQVLGSGSRGDAPGKERIGETL